MHRIVYSLILILPAAIAADRQPGTVDDLAAEGARLYSTGAFAPAADRFRAALAALPPAPAAASERAAILANLAAIHRDSGDYQESEHLSRESLRYIVAAHGEQSARYAIGLGILASIHSNRANYWLAEERIDRALAIGRDTLDASSREYAGLLTIRAEIIWRRHGCRKAMRPFREALEAVEHIPDAGPVELARARQNTAVACLNCGHLEAALRYADSAVAALDRSAQSSYVALSARNTQLSILVRTAALDRAATLAEPLLADARRYHADQPLLAAVLGNVAEIHESRHEYAAAATLLEEALHIHERTLGTAHPKVAGALIDYARVLRKLQQTEEAQSLEIRARAIAQTLH